jgi:hypothetical protein
MSSLRPPTRRRNGSHRKSRELTVEFSGIGSGYSTVRLSEFDE